MYIVNAGPAFKKMLWPAAQKFLDAKTIAKIQVKHYNLQLTVFHTLFFLKSYWYYITFPKFQVLEPKSLCKLMDNIDSR